MVFLTFKKGARFPLRKIRVRHAFAAPTSKTDEPSPHIHFFGPKMHIEHLMQINGFAMIDAAKAVQGPIDVVRVVHLECRFVCKLGGSMRHSSILLEGNTHRDLIGGVPRSLCRREG